MIHLTETHGEIRFANGEVGFFDLDDLQLVMSRRWQFHHDGRGKFYVRSTTRPRVYLHRLLTGNQPTFTDHRDGNGLDCRRHNLRTATYNDNNRNRRSPVPDDSGYRGVHRIPGGRRFRGRLECDGRKISTAPFDDPADAARALDALATAYFGEFAVLNFPAESILAAE